MTTKTLVQRIHDLCVAIGNDLKSIKTAVDKNTAVNDDQDKNIKAILEDPDRVKITDFYHYDTAKQESYLASGMTSLRLYHDKVYRLYFQDETVAQRSQPKNTTAIIFKLNHNNGGVIQLHNEIADATTSRSLRYYPCTVAKDKTLTPIPVFNAEKHLYFIPIGESEFAIAFENHNNYGYDFRAVDFILNGQKYEIYLSKHNLPYQFSKTNQPKPDYGIIQSLDNSNLIRNSLGNLGKENFSQFNTNPINFGRAEFYTRDSWAIKQLDDYYYWDKNAKSYDIQMTLSQTHSAYTKTYAYIVPYDPDGLRIYAHTIAERSEDFLLPESTPTRLVISDEYGISGLVNYFKTIGNTKFALIIPGCRFIEEKMGRLNTTDRHLCGAKFHPQVSQAIIATDLVQGQNVNYTIVDDTTVTIELLNGLSIPEPILELMEYGFSVTKHNAAYCYYLPEVRNTSVPDSPTTYNASISTIYPYPNNDPNHVFNKIFKNYAHYFKIGFLINRFSGAPVPLEEYIEYTGEPLQFTIHSMKMSVNYS